MIPDDCTSSGHKNKCRCRVILERAVVIAVVVCTERTKFAGRPLAEFALQKGQHGGGILGTSYWALVQTKILTSHLL